MCWDKVRFFTKEEWKQNPDRVSKKLVLTVDDLRYRASLINPRTTCIIHEAWASSGHAPKSYHYTGLAVDLHFTHLDIMDQWGILSSCRAIGGLGYYPDWNNPGWHIDLRPVQYRLTWLCHRHNYIYGPTVITDFLYNGASTRV